LEAGVVTKMFQQNQGNPDYTKCFDSAVHTLSAAYAYIVATLTLLNSVFCHMQFMTFLKNQDVTKQFQCDLSIA